MKKHYTTEEMRNKIDNSFKAVVRGGELCILYVEENKEYNEEEFKEKIKLAKEGK